MTNWVDVKDSLPAAAAPYDYGAWVAVKTKSLNWYKACLCEYSIDDVRWVSEKGSEVLDVTHWQYIDV